MVMVNIGKTYQIDSTQCTFFWGMENNNKYLDVHRCSKIWKIIDSPVSASICYFISPTKSETAMKRNNPLADKYLPPSKLNAFTTRKHGEKLVLHSGNLT